MQWYLGISILCNDKIFSVKNKSFTNFVFLISSASIQSWWLISTLVHPKTLLHLTLHSSTKVVLLIRYFMKYIRILESKCSLIYLFVPKDICITYVPYQCIYYIQYLLLRVGVDISPNGLIFFNEGLFSCRTTNHLHWPSLGIRKTWANVLALGLYTIYM